MENFFKELQERGAIPEDTVLNFISSSFPRKEREVLSFFEERYRIGAHTILPEAIWEVWEEILKKTFPT